MLQIQGTSNRTAYGRATINTSTKFEAIPSTSLEYAGPISLSLGPPRNKSITKGYIAIFVCFVTKAVQIEVVIILSTEAFLAALRLLLHVEGNQGPFVQTMVPTFKVLPMNFMQSTKCFNPHHR